MPWVLDLDGVVWRGAEPIPGAAEAVDLLDGEGEDWLCVTNNSAATLREQIEKLAQHGIDAGGRVVSSATAAASMVEPGERVFVCGGPGIVEAVEARGAIVTDGDADAVLVGLDRDFSYEVLSRAAERVRAGARLIGTNHDPTYPTATRLLAGGGAIVAAVATAAEATPVFAGKPNRPMAGLVRARLGGQGICVGDRPDSDGLFARTLGYRFGLVLSGVTDADDLPVDPAPDMVARDLLGLVRAELGLA